MTDRTNGWTPFLRGKAGQLMLIQQVSYSGINPSWLGFGDGPEAIGAFAKVDENILDQLISGDPDGPEWPAFRKRHRRRGGGSLDDLEIDELQAALQPEPNALVAKLLYNQVIKDTEGSFSQLVTLGDAHFAGMTNRAAWFAPVLAKELEIFEVGTCIGWFSAFPLFIRAKSRADAMHQIFHDASLAPLREQVLGILTRTGIRTAGNLPSKRDELEPALQQLKPKALLTALDFAYAKGDAICCFSVVEASVPVVLPKPTQHRL